MFENILAQDEVVAELTGLIEEREIPPALLFSGPAFSGKLTTALEMARVLTCRGTGTWRCGCESCEKQRVLGQAYTLLLGGRCFQDEVRAAGKILLEQKKDYARYMLIRGVRKISRRYDPALWEGTEPRFKKAKSAVAEMEELIQDLMPDRQLPAEKGLQKIVDKLNQAAAKAEGGSENGNIPVDQIRRINRWVHRASDSHKIIILENAEQMQESSRNSLLKTLEEPPPGVTFLLISARKGAIMPTILSRVRNVSFRARSREEQGYVLSRIFRQPEQPNGGDLRGFFLSQRLDLAAIRRAAGLFFESAIAGSDSPGTMDGIRAMIDANAKEPWMNPFFQEMTEIGRQRLRDNSLDAGMRDRIRRVNQAAQDTVQTAVLYNQRPELAVEGLYYRLTEGDRRP